MKKVISQVFSFIKHMFLYLRLVVTLNIGRNNENEEHRGLDCKGSREREDTEDD